MTHLEPRPNLETKTEASVHVGSWKMWVKSEVRRYLTVTKDLLSGGYQYIKPSTHKGGIIERTAHL